MLTSPSDSSSLFKRRHFDSSIIILCVRWYITYKLSYRDLEKMAERGIDLAHTTILRWVLRYVSEFEKKSDRFARPVSTSWRVEETFIRFVICSVTILGRLAAGPSRPLESSRQRRCGSIVFSTRRKT